MLPNRLAFDVADPRDDDDDDDDDGGGGDNRSIARRRSSSLANRGFESPSPRSFDPARATTAPRRSRRARRVTAEADAEDEDDAARVVLTVGAARVHRATSMTRARVNDFRFRRGHRTDHATDGRALDEADPGGGARAAAGVGLVERATVGRMVGSVPTTKSEVIDARARHGRRAMDARGADGEDDARGVVLVLGVGLGGDAPRASRPTRRGRRARGIERAR